MGSTICVCLAQGYTYSIIYTCSFYSKSRLIYNFYSFPFIRNYFCFDVLSQCITTLHPQILYNNDIIIKDIIITIYPDYNIFIYFFYFLTMVREWMMAAFITFL